MDKSSEFNEEEICDNESDDFVYKQMRGEGYIVDDMIPLLQAILTMLLIAGKTPHEPSEVIGRLSQLSRPSLSSYKPAVLSPRSQCSCLMKSSLCSKVISALTGKVADMASIGKAWYRQYCAAFNYVKESVIISVISAIMTETQVIRIAGKLETKYKTVK